MKKRILLFALSLATNFVLSQNWIPIWNEAKIDSTSGTMEPNNSYYDVGRYPNIVELQTGNGNLAGIIYQSAHLTNEPSPNSAPKELSYIRQSIEDDLTLWESPIVLVDTVTYAKMEMIDGHPAIIYLNKYHELYYNRASDQYGDLWNNSPVRIDSFPNRYNRFAMTELDGLPAITYYNISQDTVYFRKSSDAIGSSWTKSVVDKDIGHMNNDWPWVSVDLINANGKPAIAYSLYNNGGDALRYARAQDAAGTSWPTIDSIESETYNIVMEVIDGKPSILFKDYGSDPNFIQATDANGSNWNNRTLINNGSSFVEEMPLVDFNGKPGIAQEIYSSQFSFIEASSTDGTTWNNPLDTIVANSFIYSSYDLAVVNGKLLAAYSGYSPTNGRALSVAQRKENVAAFIGSLQNNGKFNLYPNPTNSVLNFDLSNDKAQSLKIFDLTGKTVSLKNHVSNQIDVSNLEKGVYLLQINTSKGKLTQKFVKN